MASHSVMGPAGVEKSATEAYSSTESLLSNQNREDSNPVPSDIASQQNRTKEKELKGLEKNTDLHCLLSNVETNCAARKHQIRLSHNRDIRTFIDANKQMSEQIQRINHSLV